MSRRILSNSFAESDYSWQMTQDKRIEDLENATPEPPIPPEPSIPSMEQVYYNPDPSADMGYGNAYVGSLDADEDLIVVCAYDNDTMADYSITTILSNVYMQPNRKAIISSPFGYRYFTYSTDDFCLTWEHGYANDTTPEIDDNLIIPIYVYKMKIERTFG